MDSGVRSLITLVKKCRRRLTYLLLQPGRGIFSFPLLFLSGLFAARHTVYCTMIFTVCLVGSLRRFVAGGFFMVAILFQHTGPCIILWLWQESRWSGQYRTLEWSFYCHF